MRAVITTFSALFGCAFGYIAAHHFPFWGGFMVVMAPPYSVGRGSVAPLHMLVFAGVLGALGYAAGRNLEKSSDITKIVWLTLLVILLAVVMVYELQTHRIGDFIKQQRSSVNLPVNERKDHQVVHDSHDFFMQKIKDMGEGKNIVSTRRPDPRPGDRAR